MVCRQPHIVDYLLSVGADAHIPNNEGQSALDTAVYTEQPHIARALTTGVPLINLAPAVSVLLPLKHPRNLL